MIAILMSAYNGAKYIEEQIGSLLSQTFQDFVIYIRIDGSTDGTTEIVDRYVEKYPEKIKHVDVKRGNLGCGQSFMWLLENVNADYYMYCDQDDVWLQTKIEETLRKMKEHDETGHEGVPCVVFTDAIIVDAQMNVMFESLWKSNHRNPDDAKDFYRYAIYRQAALGCTMMFNNEARRLALGVKQFPDRKHGRHDRLIVLLCAKFGIVDYIDKSLIKYRQHNNNVSSYLSKTNNNKMEIVRLIMLSPKQRFDRIFSKFSKLRYMPFHVSYTRLFFTMCGKWFNMKRWNK